MKNIFTSSKVAAVSIVSMVFGLLSPMTALAAGPDAVNLYSAGNFVVLSEAGVTNTGSHTSVITGNIGASPITATAMNNVFCSEITGALYGVDAAYVGNGNQTCFAGNPPSSNKTLVDQAVLDMGVAYADAAGRTNPTATELGAGNIGGMTLAAGLYKWSSDVLIPTNVTLSGSASDVWIFQVAGNLNVASAGAVYGGTQVVLAGGAQASNVFWQVGGGTGATIGTYATFNGTILSATQVILETGAVLHGRAFAQTQVTLDANTVSMSAVTPAPSLAMSPRNQCVLATVNIKKATVQAARDALSSARAIAGAVRDRAFNVAMDTRYADFQAAITTRDVALNSTVSWNDVETRRIARNEARATYQTSRWNAESAFYSDRKMATNAFGIARSDALQRFLSVWNGAQNGYRTALMLCQSQSDTTPLSEYSIN